MQDVHDHRWVFSSMVVCGTTRHHILRETKVEKEGTESWFVYDYVRAPGSAETDPFVAQPMGEGLMDASLVALEI